MRSNASLKSPSPLLAMAGFGLAAGLISSLAISGLLLLVERISELPVGTFYLVLVSALLQTQDFSVGAALLGLLMHIAAGSMIGLAVSVPLASRRIAKYAPVYGLAAGFLLWIALFIPVTYGVMIPLLNTMENQEITQQVPAGKIYEVATSDLLGMIDRVIIGSFPFNMFYGLLTAMLTKSMYESYLRRKHQLIA
ncbi:MAG TPA: hypothetical protein VNI77_09695 [Nitrososphaera sp.]|nr:hypothetical protein [Nitrososphaera sp.]